MADNDHRDLDARGPAASSKALDERRRHIARTGLRLFLARGFDAVTVEDIAEAAGVGRATVFRYFGEKTEIVFADAPALETAMVDAAQATAERLAPIGSNLATALQVAQAGLRAIATHCAEHLEQVTAMDALTATNATLRTARVAKERRYAQRVQHILIDSGTDDATAALTGHLAIAIYAYAREHVGNDLVELGSAIDDALAQLTSEPAR